ncbi:MAG: type II toxin-antitoxin system VapC family toxin [Methylovulum sp.]|nr:MAG: type II toxin-antitoxin system VapC family toxin [Methylovulum sp.]
MSIVDANIILRYVLDDHVELSPKAADILEQYAATLPMEVACEVVYVLQKVYAVNRKDIQQQLSNLLDEKLVDMDKPAIFLKALEYYRTSTLDFVDTLLWAYHVIERQDVFTFDDKLRKCLQRSDQSM